MFEYSWKAQFLRIYLSIFVPLRGAGIIERCCFKPLTDDLNSLSLLILITYVVCLHVCLEALWSGLTNMM